MIYAIRAVGTEFVKIGKANSVGRRLKELDTACPHELHIEAAAGWPDQLESAIHFYLEDHCEKFEWFRDGERTAQIIEWLREQEAGQRKFKVALIKHARVSGRAPQWLAPEFPSQKKPKRAWATAIRPSELPPEIPTLVTDEERRQANERFEHIKQRAIARKAAKRSQEALSQPTGGAQSRDCPKRPRALHKR